MPTPFDYRQQRLEIATSLFGTLAQVFWLYGDPGKPNGSIKARELAEMAVGYADLLIQSNQAYPVPSVTPDKPQPPLL